MCSPTPGQPNKARPPGPRLPHGRQYGAGWQACPPQRAGNHLRPPGNPDAGGASRPGPSAPRSPAQPPEARGRRSLRQQLSADRPADAHANECSVAAGSTGRAASQPGAAPHGERAVAKPARWPARILPMTRVVKAAPAGSSPARGRGRSWPSRSPSHVQGSLAGVHGQPLLQDPAALTGGQRGAPAGAAQERALRKIQVPAS